MAQSGQLIEANRTHALARLMAAQDGAETAFPRADLALIGPDGRASPGPILPGHE